STARATRASSSQRSSCWAPVADVRMSGPSERVRRPYNMGMRAVRLVTAALTSLALAAALAACGRSGPPDRVSIAEEPIVEPGQIPDGVRVVVVAVGAGLAAGLGLLSEEAYPAQLQVMFAAEGYAEVDVVNAGVSGDTSAGGLRRAAL